LRTHAREGEHCWSQLAREAAYREYATHWTAEALAAFSERIDRIAAGVAEG
jgi:hypothetical protein